MSNVKSKEKQHEMKTSTLDLCIHADADSGSMEVRCWYRRIIGRSRLMLNSTRSQPLHVDTFVFMRSEREVYRCS